MSTGPKATTATIIPTLRYKDAVKAIDWLCGAFGFEKRLVVPGDDGGIAHAQLVFGTAWSCSARHGTMSSMRFSLR